MHRMPSFQAVPLLLYWLSTSGSIWTTSNILGLWKGKVLVQLKHYLRGDRLPSKAVHTNAIVLYGIGPQIFGSFAEKMVVHGDLKMVWSNGVRQWPCPREIIIFKWWWYECDLTFISEWQFCCSVHAFILELARNTTNTRKTRIT